MGVFAAGNPVRTTRSSARRAVVVLLAVLFAGQAGTAAAVNFGAFWQYRASGGDNVDTQRSLEQRYRFGAGEGIQLAPTGKITLRGDVSYNRQQTYRRETESTSQSLTPSASLLVNNDIFRATLSGSTTRNWWDDGRDSTTYDWQARLANGTEKPFWPHLDAFYAESTSEKEARRGTSKSKGSRHGLGVDWDVAVAKLFYSYNHSSSEDLVGGSRSEQDSHFGRLETEGRFLDNRIAVTFDQQVAHSTSRFFFGSPAGGAFERPLGGLASFIAFDLIGAPDPDLAELEPSPVLGDGILEGGHESIEAGQRGHLGLRLRLSQQVDRMHVYLEPFPPFPVEEAEALEWDLYARVGELWTLERKSVESRYDPAAGRFEIEVGGRFQEWKVVVVNRGSTTLQITEVEGVELLSADASTEVTSYLSNASLRIRFTPTLTGSSSVALEGTERQGAPGISRRTINGSLVWNPTPLFSPRVGFSESRDEESGSPAAIVRGYSLNVSSRPLPTLGASFGAGRSEQFLGGHRTSRGDRLYMSYMAELYPDLTAGFDVAYRTTIREEEDAGTTTKDQWTSGLNLNATLSPTLRAELATSYSQSGGEQRVGTLTSLAYRPSSILSASVSHTRDWTDDRVPDSLSASVRAALLRTTKTRLSAVYGYQRAVDSSHTYGLDGSWDINRSLVFRGQGRYSVADAATWNMQASLSLQI